jgi:hypothetical protein
MIVYQVIQWHPDMVIPSYGYYQSFNQACSYAERRALEDRQEYRIVRIYLEEISGAIYKPTIDK